MFAHALGSCRPDKGSSDGQEVINGKRVDSLKAHRRSNVLVVEDEPILRYDTVEFLERAGHRVLEAANADEAMVFLRRNDIDTLFTDIDMPGSIDGLGLVKRVRRSLAGHQSNRHFRPYRAFS
ncbi:response regulator [Rhizobium indicum]|uniref:response regulator n=1 Tax=Rhizobium indicum TaxID=2583231 RepID=UPI002484CDE3|nr:response regulator [Rhizobium indicum]